MGCCIIYCQAMHENEWIYVHFFGLKWELSLLTVPEMLSPEMQICNSVYFVVSLGPKY